MTSSGPLCYDKMATAAFSLEDFRVVPLTGLDILRSVQTLNSMKTERGDTWAKCGLGTVKVNSKNISKYNKIVPQLGTESPLDKCFLIDFPDQKDPCIFTII